MVLQRKLMGYIDIYKRRIIIGIGSPIIEAEKSHSLPSASWKASGIIESMSKGLRARTPVVRQQKRWVSQLTKREEVRGRECALPPPFCSTQMPSGLHNACPHQGEQIGTHSTQSNAHLSWKHPQRHMQKECFTSYLGIPQAGEVDTKLTIITHLVNSPSGSIFLLSHIA